ncbi:hypothetical protein SeMB42_g00340 [Synchytrium endobioticum]|uniref:Uncharacterized protein n=1 Tax=Synchytrium endobioticum TaxID=286115 RepID=A0A507DRA3_9FUNG|nr:hypothetical protein SeMB42_g00340 [Synchytrium endobioticum]
MKVVHPGLARARVERLSRRCENPQQSGLRVTQTCDLQKFQSCYLGVNSKGDKTEQCDMNLSYSLCHPGTGRLYHYKTLNLAADIGCQSVLYFISTCT